MLELSELSFAYCDGSVSTRGGRGKSAWVLKDISLKIQRGQFVGLFGPNGSGKSTLLKVIAGILRPRTGEINLGGQPYDQISRKKLAKTLALILQDNTLSFPVTVGDFIRTGRYPHLKWYQFMDAETEGLQQEVMRLTDTSHLADRLFHVLSGGEKQRVMIARALMQASDVFLLDEVTAHLDPYYQIQVLEMLKQFHRDFGKTIVLASHDINLVARYVGRVVMLDKGRIWFDGAPAEVLSPQNLEKIFSCRAAVQIRDGMIDSIQFAPGVPHSSDGTHSKEWL